MPRVKLDYVVSFSSEDPENPASNLLAHEVSKKKWLCNAGEPSCSVVLQLKQAVQISTVHIGAYHAALVEVLVGRSETPNDPYEVLVPSSVFLSPMDSRRGAGVERVRSFSAEQLAPARARRWDRVRLVCSQPYNKHCKYGLSFVHIFEEEAKSLSQPEPAAPAVPARVAAAARSSSDEDDFRPGELFAKHRLSEGSKNTEAQIRQASSQALRNISDSATKLVKTPITKTNSSRSNQSSDFNTSRQRDTLLYTDDDDRPHTKIDSVVQRHKDEKEQETKKKEAVQNLFKKNNDRTNRLEAASKNFKEFLDDKDDKKNSSRSNDSSRDDKRSREDNARKRDSSRDDKRSRDENARNKDSSRDDGRSKDLNNSTSKDSSRSDDRRNKDNLNNSRNKDSSRDNDKIGTTNFNDSKTNSRDNEKRNRADGNTSRTKRDAGASGDRENRKRQHSDDRQKDKAEVLRAGPISSSPHSLMSTVVFALSGYENPRRARLRDAAVAMGARFERDWSPRCTHLICAFPNTPKLRTVRSSPQGSNCIAVLGEWIEQCCEKRRMLPWQWFATEPKRKVQPPTGWDDDDKTASECDTDDEIEKVLRKQKRQRTDKSPSPQPSTSKEQSPKPHTSKDQSPKPHTSRDLSPKPHNSRDRSPKPHTSRDLSPKPQTSRDQSPKPHTSRDRSPKPHTSRDRSPKPHTSRNQSPKPHSSREKSPKPHSSKEKSPKQNSSKECPKRSRKRSQSNESKQLNHSNISTDSDVAFVKDERIQANITIDSGDSTDEEKPMAKERIDKSCVLPDFFDGYTFVIEDCVENFGFDKELLKRYVRAYGGVVVDPAQMESDSEISFVLGAGAGASSNGLRVRADWLWRCHHDKTLCDVAGYTL